MGDFEHSDALKSGYSLLSYEIVSVIGQGGFGITYLAKDRYLGDVAIKEYLPAHWAIRSNDSSLKPRSVTNNSGYDYAWGLTRFLEEARALFQFRHPNIVRVLNVFEANGTAYMVMDLERGKSLDDFIKSKYRLTEEALRDLLNLLLEGLRHVHEAGYLHRDITPRNIIIREDGSPVLIDFGSSRQAIGVTTRPLTVVVSPGYAPLEQQHLGEGVKQGPWTDIYGLGATLYHLLTGEQPMDAQKRMYIQHEQGVDPLTPAVQVGAGRYSPAFLQAIDSALQLLSKDRPQSISEWQSLFDDSEPGVINTAIDQHVADTLVSSDTVIRGATSQGVRDKRQPFGAGIEDSEQNKKISITSENHTLTSPMGLREEVQCLLARGEAQCLHGQLMEPAKDNAYETYLQALELDPDNDKAKEEVLRVSEQAFDQARDEAQPGRRTEVIKSILGHLRDGLEVMSDQEGLLALQRRVEGELEATKEAEQRLRNEIRVRLSQAQEQWSKGHLTTPAGDNAYETYLDVLREHPGDLEARQEMGKVAEQVLQKALEESMPRRRQEKLQALLEHLTEALRIVPDNDDLLALRPEAEREYDATKRAEQRLREEVQDYLTRAQSQVAHEHLMDPSGKTRTRAILRSSSVIPITMRRWPAFLR